MNDDSVRASIDQVLKPGRFFLATQGPLADLIFPSDFAGKTVLDVGCYYGYFLHEAIRRGAERAVGIEANPERFQISSKLSQLWNGKIDICQGLVEDVKIEERFDYVIFLNILHHVIDPVAVMRRLVSLCRGTLIVEFRQPVDREFLFECFHKPGQVERGGSLVGRTIRRARMGIEGVMMRAIMGTIPMIGVASVEYHRSYFFSPRAFSNTFQIHNKLFREVEFRPSLAKGQILAFCDCRPE